MHADYLAETDWMTYEFSAFDDPTHRFAQYRGQRQKWFALRFTGRDEEVDPLSPRNGPPAEFDCWRWERLDRMADLVVPFRREVYRDERYVALTRKQFAVLQVLAEAGGGVVSAEQLLERAWDENADPFTNAVRITISGLRKRLGEPWLIETVSGVGYRVGGPDA